MLSEFPNVIDNISFYIMHFGLALSSPLQNRPYSDHKHFFHALLYLQFLDSQFHGKALHFLNSALSHSRFQPASLCCCTSLNWLEVPLGYNLYFSWKTPDCPLPASFPPHFHREENFMPWQSFSFPASGFRAQGSCGRAETDSVPSASSLE